MGKKSGPKAPNPVTTAKAQSDANKEAILASAQVNRYDDIGPSGSVTWDHQQPVGETVTGKYGSYTKPPDPNDPGTWTRTTSLGAPEQRQKDQRDYVAESLGNTAKTLAGQIPSSQFNYDGLPGVDRYQELGALMAPDAYSADADKVEQATYDRMQNLMRPQFDERTKALDNRLAVMGLPVSGEAYGVEKDREGRLRNEADLNASLEAVRAGRSEQSRMFGQELAGRQQLGSEQLAKIASQRQDRATGTQERLTERTQPFNELAAILQGSPSIQAPTPGNVASYQMAAPDISGLIQNQYNTKAQNQASKKGGTGSLIGTLGGAALGQPAIGGAIGSALFD